MSRIRVERARVVRNRTRYVLIDPCWMLLMVEMRGVLTDEIALGPIFSNQVKSIIWVAIICPKIRFILGEAR